jgi:hypothetical protein
MEEKIRLGPTMSGAWYHHFCCGDSSPEALQHLPVQRIWTDAGNQIATGIQLAQAGINP